MTVGKRQLLCFDRHQHHMAVRCDASRRRAYLEFGVGDFELLQLHLLGLVPPTKHDRVTPRYRRTTALRIPRFAQFGPENI